MKRCDIINKDPAEVKIAVLLICLEIPTWENRNTAFFTFYLHCIDLVLGINTILLTSHTHYTPLWQVIIVYGYIIMKVIFATYIVLCQILTLAE